MKGFTNIKLYDAHGNVVQDQDDNNMITNLLEDYIKEFGSVISQTQSTISGEVERIMSQNDFSALKLIGGILLFENPIEEKATNTVANQFSIASAGSRNDYSHALKGSLNTNESSEVNENGKKGYKWVWDFGTSNANCTFNSVCLTTKDAGDRTATTNEDGYIGNQNIKTEFFTDGKQRVICLTDEYLDYKMLDDGLYKRRTKKSLSFNDKISFFEYEKVNLGSIYSGFSSCIIESNNSVYIIALNSSTGEKDLIKINIDNTVNITELTGLHGVYSNIIEYFGIVGEDIIFDMHREAEKNMLFRCFNIQTKEYEVVNTGLEVLYNPLKNSMYNRVSLLEGEAKRPVSIFTLATSNNRFFTIEIISKQVFRLKDNVSVQSQCITTPTNNVGILGKTVDSYNKHLAETILFPIWREPLFTINNLESPITKTEANTMKISYTIMY